jgi:hypothetical protein
MAEINQGPVGDPTTGEGLATVGEVIGIVKTEVVNDPEVQAVLQGPQGEPGADGAPGEQGPPGIQTVADQAALDAIEPDAGNPVYLVLEDMSLWAWDGADWAAVSSGGAAPGGGTEAPIVVAADMAALAQAVPAPVNGQKAVIRIGSQQDVFDIPLVYVAARAKWVQPGQGFPAVRTTEQNAFRPAGGPNNVEVKQYIPMSNTPNGWGFTAMRNMGAALAAGLALEYRHEAFVRPTAGIGFYVGAAFYLYNPGDLANVAYTNPPTNHWAETDYLYSGPATLGFYNVKTSGWKTLQGPIGGGNSNLVAAGSPHSPLAAEPKTTLYPAIYGRTDAGGQAAGVQIGFLNYALHLRFVG